MQFTKTVRRVINLNPQKFQFVGDQCNIMICDSKGGYSRLDGNRRERDGVRRNTFG